MIQGSNSKRFRWKKVGKNKCDDKEYFVILFCLAYVFDAEKEEEGGDHVDCHEDSQDDGSYIHHWNMTIIGMIRRQQKSSVNYHKAGMNHNRYAESLVS